MIFIIDQSHKNIDATFLEKDTNSSERVKIHEQGIFNLFTLHLEDFSARKIHSPPPPARDASVNQRPIFRPAKYRQAARGAH